MADTTPDLPIIAEPSSQGQPQPAGFWLRAIAKLADCLVLLVITSIFVGLVALLHTFGISGFWSFWFLILGLTVLQVVYFAFLTSEARQTLGYRLAGVRVETVSHQPVSWWRSLGRAILNSIVFGLATSILIGWIDYLLIGLTRSKRALHDMLTGTQVCAS